MPDWDEMLTSTTPMLEVVLIGEAVAHSMSSDHLSIPEALVMVATLLFWSVALDAVAYRFPRLGRVLEAQPRPLIEDGEINRRALRREFMSRDELDTQLRLQGVRDIGRVRRAYLEPNVMVSVFTDDCADECSPDPPSTM